MTGRSGLAGLVAGWRHEDGTACPTHLNQPGEQIDLWCTEHQKFIRADLPTRLSPEWTVRDADGHWAADARDAQHAADVAGLMNGCYDAPPILVGGPYRAHRADPAKALVPVPSVWFNGGCDGFRRVRVIVDQAPPRDTIDGGRWERCTDHRLACDCREAEMRENLDEYFGMWQAARDAAAVALAGHDTRGYESGTPCPCAGCEIARRGYLR
jgi:hypothetical protein